MSDYAVVNPATGETVKKYPTISDAELEAAIGRADAAHRAWAAATTVEERAALIRRVGELHDERRQELAEIIVREMGKPIEQAVGEVEFSAAIYEYYADNAREAAGRRADRPARRATARRSSAAARSALLLGIMPWNYPYYQVARFAGPNLVIGNTILLKHAPQCPESAAAMEQIFHEAGVPTDAYINIYATNDQIADGHRRPARAGRLADRLRARRRRGRRDRRAQPEEGRARARRLGPVHRARHRRPRRGRRGRRRRRAWRTPGRRATPPSASSSSTTSTTRSWRSSPPR